MYEEATEQERTLGMVPMANYDLTENVSLLVEILRVKIHYDLPMKLGKKVLLSSKNFIGSKLYVISK